MIPLECFTAPNYNQYVTTESICRETPDKNPFTKSKLKLVIKKTNKTRGKQKNKNKVSLVLKMFRFSVHKSCLWHSVSICCFCFVVDGDDEDGGDGDDSSDPGPSIFPKEGW